MKKALFTLGLILTTMISYGQSFVWSDAEMDKNLVKSETSVSFYFQNMKYKALEDMGLVILGTTNPAAEQLIDKMLLMIENGTSKYVEFNITGGTVGQFPDYPQYVVITDRDGRFNTLDKSELTAMKAKL